MVIHENRDFVEVTERFLYGTVDFFLRRVLFEEGREGVVDLQGEDGGSHDQERRRQDQPHDGKEPVGDLAAEGREILYERHAP